MKNLSTDIPNSLSVDVTTIYNQMAISNVFNKYFFNIADKTKHNRFSDFHKSRSNVSFF